MNFKIRQSLILSFMVFTLMASAGYATQQSVISYHFGRNVDANTAAAFVHDDAKFLEYKNQVQPFSDMPPEEYIKIKTDKPLVPVAELVSTHRARQELGRLSIKVPTSEHEEAAGHLLSLGHKGFENPYLESVIELQTDPDKTGLLDKKPSTARIVAMAFFQKVSHKPTEAELDVMAYIVDPEHVIIKEPKPEEFRAALYLMDLRATVIAKPAADDIKAAEELMRMGVPPTAATVAAILYFNLPTIRIAKPSLEFLKAAAYLLDPLAPVIEKPTPEEIQAAEVLLDRVKMTAPTAPEVKAILILWASQFGEKPYMNVSLPHIQALSKGTTEAQKSLIAWYVQKTRGNIPGGVAEVLKPDFHYQYFRFVPVAFDPLASKAASCLFSAGDYGSPGIDGFRVFSQAYPTGLKEGERFVFEDLVPDKARTDAVSINGIDKP